MQKVVVLFLLLIFSASTFAQVQTGKASFYADKFEKRITANGEVYLHNKPTAAHRHLPFGTKVKVTNLANDTNTIVTINDRGPFISGRIIDLSRSSAKKLGFLEQGVTDVVIEVIDDDKNNALSKTETGVIVNTSEERKTSSSEIKTSNNTVEAAKNAEFYELSINRVQPEGFGVQIGSFQEMTNLIRLADNLKSSYQKEVTVQVKTVQGVKIYSLVLGNYNNREKAERFLKKVTKKYPDSFIIDFSILAK